MIPAKIKYITSPNINTIMLVPLWANARAPSLLFSAKVTIINRAPMIKYP